MRVRKDIFAWLWLLSFKCIQGQRPNIVVIFADDLGYGDLGLYFGHPTSSTPNLDRLAQQSKVFKSFYSASPLCSPSRASLLTGLYPPSTGVYSDVFWPDYVGGLSSNHSNLAKSLKSLGYRTSIVGKWHLGVGLHQEHLPTNHGFDSYFGIPYSHDMCPLKFCFPGHVPCDGGLTNSDPYVSCPLFQDNKIIEQPTDLTTLTARLVQEAVDFIQTSSQSEDPFFLYLPMHQTHHPQFAGKRFYKSSIRGRFGDALAEMDGAVGQVMDALAESAQSNNTLIIMTSDNGPSLLRETFGGCAGPLRCGKGTTFEGGMRVPAMISWPGVIKPGVSHELMATIDIYPTLLSIVSGSPPLDVHGLDQSQLLLRDGQSSRSTFLYYSTHGDSASGPFAVRYKNFKAHFLTRGDSLSNNQSHDQACRGSNALKPHDPPLLFDLSTDPGELWPLNTETSKSKKILLQVEAAKTASEASVWWDEDQMKRGSDRLASPCCSRSPRCEPFPSCCDCVNDIKHPAIEVLG